MSNWPNPKDRGLAAEVDRAIGRVLDFWASRPFDKVKANDLLAEVAVGALDILKVWVPPSQMRASLKAIAAKLERYEVVSALPAPVVIDAPTAPDGRRSARLIASVEMDVWPSGGPTFRVVAWVVLRAAITRAQIDLGAAETAAIVRMLLARMGAVEARSAA